MFESTKNTTRVPLLAGATFTGEAERSNEQDVMVYVHSDVDCTLFFEMSADYGENWDISHQLEIKANLPEQHRYTKAAYFVRVRLVNVDQDQTHLRLFTYFGKFSAIEKPLNSAVQIDEDASTVRAFGEELLIAEGLVNGCSVVNKFGRNSDIDTGSVPEDLWNGGGVYTGFPTGEPEEFVAFSSSASDTGVLTFSYLPDFSATEWLSASVTLNGTTTVNTGITGVRMHTARYNNGSATSFNVGEITVRHITTTANVFSVMPIGRSQTNICAYTIPAGSTGYVRRLFARVIGSNTGQVDGALWVRLQGESPRLRRPFSATTGSSFEERPYGGLAIPAGADVSIRVSNTSANNLDVIGGFDLLVVRG